MHYSARGAHNALKLHYDGHGDFVAGEIYEIEIHSLGELRKVASRYGKAEREKFEAIKESVSEPLRDIYEKTESLHDGKWLWIPLDDKLVVEDALAMLKIKRKPNRR